MKEKPSVFAGKVDKKAGNNTYVAYSTQEQSAEVITQTNGDNNLIHSLKEKNINQKINEIFTSSNYVYKADVEITLKKGKVTKRIIGKNSTHLITMENELIPISDIIDIKMAN